MDHIQHLIAQSAELSCGSKVVSACGGGNPEPPVLDTRGERSHHGEEDVLSGLVSPWDFGGS